MNGSLEPIFRPRSVAVVGASRRRDSIGWALVDNLLRSGFQGAVFPVNPRAGAVHSLKCHASIAAIGEEIDLGVVAVPRAAVEAVIDDCIEHGVKGLVVITAGFAETGEEGAEIERRIRDRVRAAGVRLVGPNCMGVINTDPAICLDATFAPTPARRGSIGFVSQSGALGVAILNVATQLGIGLTQFVSMGNKADVSGNDLLEMWEHDDATRVIAMYLESFGNPRRFTEIAKRVTRRKPILVVKAGRTAEGARAASSHTGALAGADVTVQALLEHCGVLRADSIQDLFHMARALDRCPLPAGDRVAIVTNAGGPGIMATDACVGLGLEMAQLSAATRATLSGFLPPEASLTNPVDMISSADAEDYRRAVTAVLDDRQVDMVLVVHVTPLLSNPIEILCNAGRAAAAAAGKPVLAVMMATEDFYDAARGRSDLPPVYRFPESAAKALATLARHAAWRRRPAEPISTFEVDDGAVAEILCNAGDGYLEPAGAFRVLELYGIPTAPWQVVADRDAALAAAGELGYPVVLKAIAPDLVHKSDLGAVALDLADPWALGAALDHMARRLVDAGHPPAGYLVQRQISGGHEVVFGVSTDERFGRVLMFGLGGKYVEVLKDVRFGLIPLEPAEADDMIAGIRGAKLLAGVRGEPAADRALLREVLLRLAQLAERHPAIRELDVNPFLAAPDRESARALDVRIRVERPGAPRRGAIG